MAKNKLEWNLPPGTISESYSAEEYRNSSHVASTEDFKSILRSIVEAAAIDVSSLSISNSAAITQLARLVLQDALRWVDSGGAGYEHGEFADMFQAFWTSLLLVTARSSWSAEGFIPADDTDIDRGLGELYNREIGRVRANSLRWMIESGEFVLSDSELGPYVERALRTRRSALACLTDQAARELLPQDIRSMIDDPHPNGANLWRQLGFQDAELVIEGLSNAWRLLLEKLGLSEELLVQFIAFYASDELVMGQIRQATRGRGPTWFKVDQLFDMWRRHVIDQAGDFSEEAFYRALDLFTLSPSDKVNTKRWAPVPLFVRVGSWYLVYFPSVIMMHPNLVTFNMLMHKHEREWSETIGGGAAAAADWLSEILERESKDCVFATGIEKKPLKGDIDLAIFDRVSKVLLVCELKSVFNRYRSHQQLRSFTSGKFDKAVEQLTPKVEAICAAYKSTGAIGLQWPLKDIFSNRVNDKPSQVVPILLNWWDAFDYTLRTDNEHILCCNVRAFRFLFRQSGGRLDQLVDAIRTLSGVFCVAQATGRTLRFNGQKVDFWQEDHLNQLPPIRKLRPGVHRRFVIDLLRLLPLMPERWEEQTRAQGYDPRIFKFFDVHKRKLLSL